MHEDNKTGKASYLTDLANRQQSVPNVPSQPSYATPRAQPEGDYGRGGHGIFGEALVSRYIQLAVVKRIWALHS